MSLYAGIPGKKQENTGWRKPQNELSRNKNVGTNRYELVVKVDAEKF